MSLLALSLILAQTEPPSSSLCPIITSAVIQMHHDFPKLSSLDREAGQSAIELVRHQGSSKSFKIVEDDISQAKMIYNADAGILSTAIDQVERASNDSAQDESRKLLNTYKVTFEGVKAFGSLALTTERLENSRNLDFRRAAIVQSLQKPKQTTTVTDTYGTGTATVNSGQGSSFISGSGSTTSRSTVTAPDVEANPTAVALATRGRDDQVVIAGNAKTLESFLQAVGDIPLSIQGTEDQWGTACKIQLPHLATRSPEKWGD